MNTVLIGLGNWVRGDDGAGLAVARRLRDRVGSAVQVIESSGDPAELLAAWKGADVAVVVDAVASGGTAGALVRCEVGREPLPGGFSPHSTHQLGLAATIELARELDALPHALIVYGIEGERWDLGSGLSAAVEAGVERTVGAILAEFLTPS